LADGDLQRRPVMAAAWAWAALSRADAACTAGCDMVLVCNDPAAADELLAQWRPASNPDLARRAQQMEKRRTM
jgi:beta-N-acetylhexosaminidase